MLLFVTQITILFVMQSTTVLLHDINILFALTYSFSTRAVDTVARQWQIQLFLYLGEKQVEFKTVQGPFNRQKFFFFVCWSI